jgi:metal-responsive CopG/Arc/MetJ family transcriptional regulator
VVELTRKTAVSLPRSLADRAERAARRRGIPRSRLYALALEAFLVEERESNEDLTALLDAVLAREATASAPEQAAEDKALEAWLDKAGRNTWDAVGWKG